MKLHSRNARVYILRHSQILRSMALRGRYLVFDIVCYCRAELKFEVSEDVLLRRYALSACKVNTASERAWSVSQQSEYFRLVRWLIRDHWVCIYSAVILYFL